MKKNNLTLFITLLLITACKQEKSTNTVVKKEETKQEVQTTKSNYPKLISKLFDAHGSIDLWKSMQQLSFDNNSETTITALHSRKARIDSEQNSIGFDGKNVWVLEKNDQEYKGNAKFYYNLMFYFYAMPFVLGDDGITYSEIPNLEFEGVSYPGMLISYNDDVGLSPKDQYKIYINPTTGKMEWLGYTVTYFSNETSEKFSFIRYSNWESANGVKLPKTLTWYKSENNVPTEVKRSGEFTNIKLQTTVDNKLFEMLQGGKLIK